MTAERVHDDLPLSGLQVIELSAFLTAPLIGTLLADLGAEVVMVEPPDGDPYRSSVPLWPLVGRNKRSLTLDLTAPDSTAILHRLLDQSDVLVENLPPALLDRHRLSWPVVSQSHPHLVVASVSAFGAGPYESRPGNGTLAEAFVGLTGLGQSAGELPRLPPAAQADVLAAAFGAMGVLAAIFGRVRTGRGEHVELACYEPLLHALASSIVSSGSGDRRPMAWAPLRGVFQASDGHWLAVACSSARHEREVADLCGASSAQDPAAALREWVARTTRPAAMDALVNRRVPASPVNSVEDLVLDPHVRSRASVVPLTLGDHEVLVPAPCPRIGTAMRLPSLPELGDGNGALLGGLPHDGV